ncbi:MAG: peptidoglycan/LPS O-acetylase OafA/YrhL [Verrucomicrobiales bacterium]|jgi:peptidoglycan/LPS O-acetylase OafA/YrhL
MRSEAPSASSAFKDWSTLGKQEGLVLRGAGILFIMLHNFTHWVPPVTGENEFHFDPAHFATMLEQLSSSPLDSWRILFSYFGHYGVQLFVFLSAFGLTRSGMTHSPSYGAFMAKRLTALYPAVFIAAVAFLIYNTIFAGPGVTFLDNGVPLLRQIFLIGNFTGDGFTPIGPWWFLSMICQFYLVFPLLLRAMKKFGTPALLIIGGVALLIEFALNARLTAATEVNLNYTVVGHLAEFCLGMWAAYAGKMRAPAAWFALAGGIFIAGQLHPLAWLLSGLAFIVITVPLLRFVATSPARIVRFLAFYGSLSLPLFLMNGFLRNPLVWQAQIQVHNDASHAWLTTFLWSLVFLASCTGFAWIGAHLERRLRKIFA